MGDRVGLGWRPELAAGILAHLERIDLVEVMADDHFAASPAALRPLRTLAAAVPVVLHGVSMGLASAHEVKDARLAGMARLVDALQPELWSEHLAFVRADGREIGHLAAPPRNRATLDGTIRNLERARAVVGTAPAVENIATLVEPPGSEMTEAAWVGGAVRGSGATMLLDLHNLHTNALNFGFEARAWLAEIPLEQVRMVHLAGGRWTGARDGEEPRWLDDHCHEVPDAVFSLLEDVARLCPQPLTVILERDGGYPAMSVLLAELGAARGALRRGRETATNGRTNTAAVLETASTAEMETAREVEALLGRLYTETTALNEFLSDPTGAWRAAGLPMEALKQVDQRGLFLAARSYAHKRAGKTANGSQPSSQLLEFATRVVTQALPSLSRLRQRYQQATLR
jgi:uncharacterized protein (UPF0276 family)